MNRPLLALSLLALSCKKPPSAPQTADPTPRPGDSVAAGVVAALDPAADACSDFYQYACGGWLRSFELPADKVSYTRSFSSIDERNEALVRGILETAAAAPAPDPDTKRIGDLYGSCLDEATIETRGAEPLRPTLDAIAKAKDLRALSGLAGQIQVAGASPFVGGWVEGDFKDPGVNILHLYQAGLGMPDRDYYLRDDEEGKALQAKYVATIGQMLGMAGVADATAKAERVYAFERKIAEFSKPIEELRDPTKTYHRLDRSGLQEAAPQLDWAAFFAGMGAPDLQAINVTDPDFVKSLGALVAATDLDTVKAYLQWHYVVSSASLLSKDWVAASFDFFNKALVGQEADRERWKKCVDHSTMAFGEIIGKQYVDQAFAGESRALAQDLIGRVSKAFEANLPELAWMDDATRQRAAEKLNLVTPKIGYPDQWKDYSSVSTDRADFFGNVMRARAYASRREMDKVGKPVDRSEWYMVPSDVNAYYNPLMNEIAFPAGILQPPFFDKDAPMAMNYGAIGMVMGHEFTHGFDDSGAKFDGQGRMVEWWAPEAVQRFGEQTKCVADLYDTYEIREGLKVNGQLTLGENIADLGGIKEAYGAYQSWVAEHGPEDSRISGITADQLFFISFAQSWCTERTPEVEQLLATVDTHSPPRFRVNGTLSQFQGFAEAFSCEQGAPMNPATKCTVW